MESIIRNILVAFISLLFLTWLNKSAKNSKGKTYTLGQIIFTLTPIYKWVGIICSLLFIGIGLSIFITAIEYWIYGVFFILIFGGLGIFIFFISKRLFFEMNEEEISYRGIWRGTISLIWEDIETIKFNTWSSSIVFKNKKGEKVLAHAHLQGISQIIEMIEKKKGLTKKDIKLPY